MNVKTIFTQTVDSLVEFTLETGEWDGNFARPRFTPGGVEWTQAFACILELELAPSLQEALDGAELRPWFYGAGEAGYQRHGFDIGSPEAVIDRIPSSTIELAKKIVLEAQRRLDKINAQRRDAALSKDPFAGSELVYSTCS